MNERQQKIIKEFSALPSWEERYRRLIEKGQRLQGLPDALKSDDLKVKGCQSQVWIKAELDQSGKVQFLADSDAMIVKGLIALLLELYNSASPEQILETAPEFIEQIGLRSSLTPSRANGLFAMVRQIKYYAMGFELRSRCNS